VSYIINPYDNNSKKYDVSETICLRKKLGHDVLEFINQNTIISYFCNSDILIHLDLILIAFIISRGVNIELDYNNEKKDKNIGYIITGCRINMIDDCPYCKGSGYKDWACLATNSQEKIKLENVKNKQHLIKLTHSTKSISCNEIIVIPKQTSDGTRMCSKCYGSSIANNDINYKPYTISMASKDVLKF